MLQDWKNKHKPLNINEVEENSYQIKEILKWLKSFNYSSDNINKIKEKKNH